MLTFPTLIARQGLAQLILISETMTPRRDKMHEYLARARKIHNNKYDYSLVTSIFTNKEYIDIICPIHGKFNQAVSSHVNTKQGCPRCGGNFKKTTDEVLKEIKEVHGNKFIYPKFDYTNNKQKIEIVCCKHGSFFQAVKEHIKGGGCPKCAPNAKMNLDIFIRKAREKQGDKYDYSKVVYTKTDDPIIVSCPTHGDFETTAHKHLAGYGCIRCVSNSSKMENIWLDSFENPNIIRQFKLRIKNKTYNVDGFDPVNKIVYEYYGDFFHGNPKFYKKDDINPRSKKTFGQLYQNTKTREKRIEDAGYIVQYIWDSDFREQQDLKRGYKISPEWGPRCQHMINYYRMWKEADGEDCNIDIVGLLTP